MRILSLPQVRIVLRSASIALLSFLGISALFGGALLIVDPTGASVHLPRGLLNDTPFDDYFVPGIMLMVFLGGGSFLAIGSITRSSNHAPLFVIAEGVVVTIWIIGQIHMLNMILPQHLIIGFIGVLLIALGVLQWNVDR